MYLSFLGAADSLANTHFSFFHLQNMQSEYLSFHVNEERAPFPAFRACQSRHCICLPKTGLGKMGE